MVSKLLIVMTAAAAVVNAQGTTSSAGDAPTPSLTPCILGCIQPAAAQNGCSYTDTLCVCTSPQFQADAAACLQQQCTADDLQTALQLQTSECAALTDLPSTSTGATTTSVSSTSSSGATTTTPKTTTTVSKPTSTTTTKNTSTAPGSSTTASTSSASPPSTSTGAASSLVVNSGVGTIVAMIVGFLAI